MDKNIQIQEGSSHGNIIPDKNLPDSIETKQARQEITKITDKFWGDVLDKIKNS